MSRAAKAKPGPGSGRQYLGMPRLASKDENQGPSSGRSPVARPRFPRPQVRDDVAPWHPAPTTGSQGVGGFKPDRTVNEGTVWAGRAFLPLPRGYSRQLVSGQGEDALASCSCAQGPN
jgi:hypothetical protein